MIMGRADQVRADRHAAAYIPAHQALRHQNSRLPGAHIASLVRFSVTGKRKLAAIEPRGILEDDAADGVGIKPACGAVEDNAADCELALRRLAARLVIDC